VRRRVVVVGAIVLAGVAVTIAVWPRGPRPYRETFEQVREGMTLQKIEAVVGGPPEPYNTIPVIYLCGDSDPRPYENWTVNDAGLVVYFDENGRAARVIVCDVKPAPDPRTFLERLRDRLGL
jgi:outer membrane protein assembly factor BamE (lipoprotein component of BamABCDE complex)